MKEEQIKTEPIDRLFEVFNADGTKNREVIIFVLLELEINRHRKNWCNGNRLKWYKHVLKI